MPITEYSNTFKVIIESFMMSVGSKGLRKGTIGELTWWNVHSVEF